MMLITPRGGKAVVHLGFLTFALLALVVFIVLAIFDRPLADEILTIVRDLVSAFNG